MSSGGINWTAVSAIITAFAVLVALFLGLWPIVKGVRKDRAQAQLLRHQIYSQLSLIQPHILDRHTPIPEVARIAIQALEALWQQAHLLNTEEFEAVSSIISVLNPHRDDWGLTAGEVFPLYNSVYLMRQLLAKRLGYKLEQSGVTDAE